MYLKSFFFISFFILFSSATAFNITQVLGQYSDFSTFNGYLTSTQLAADINTRRTITVLVVDNGDLSQLSGKSLDVIKKIISLHVILDYFDTQKFQKLPSGSALLTTLFQASGQANGQLGFLNVTDSSGTIMFGSAVRGAPLGANLVNSVASQPYNLSVLRISDVIIPPGVDNSTPSHSPPPPPPPPQTPSSSPPAPAPVPTPSKRPPPTKSPAPSPKMSPPPSNPPPPKMSPPPSSSPPPSNAPSPSKSLSPAPSQSSSPPPSPTRATPPSPSRATPPSPTRFSPPRPALAPRPANRPAPSHPPVDAPADGPTPAASPRHHPPADESGVPATVGIQLAVVIMLVSSFWSLISCI